MIYTAHIKMKNSFNHYQQHDNHVDKWLDTKIVVKCNWGIGYEAQYIDYRGFGSTPEEAVEDLKIAMENVNE